MSAYLRRAWIVVWKDVLTERRSKESLNALLFFSVLLLFIFQFALGPERARVETALPGLLWLGFILAGVLGLGRTFLVEREITPSEDTLGPALLMRLLLELPVEGGYFRPMAA